MEKCVSVEWELEQICDIFLLTNQLIKVFLFSFFFDFEQIPLQHTHYSIFSSLYSFYFSKITNFYKYYAVEHWVYTNMFGLAALRPTPLSNNATQFPQVNQNIQ